MEEVTAWKDKSGKIHEKKIDAAAADLICSIEQSWRLLPTDADKGDPKVIARHLMGSINARRDLADAIDDYDDVLKENAMADERPAQAA